MLLAAIVFLVVTAIVAAVAFGVLRLPESLAARRLEKRLSEVSNRTEDDDKPASFIRSHAAGPLPALDRAFGRTGALAMLIEQSGTKTSPSSVVLASVALAVAAAIASLLFIRQPFAWAIAALVGAAVPMFWLKYKRSARLKLPV